MCACREGKRNKFLRRGIMQRSQDVVIISPMKRERGETKFSPERRIKTLRM